MDFNFLTNTSTLLYQQHSACVKIIKIKSQHSQIFKIMVQLLNFTISPPLPLSLSPLLNFSPSSNAILTVYKLTDGFNSIK